MKLKKAKRECDTITADLGAFSNPEDLALTLENAWKNGAWAYLRAIDRHEQKRFKALAGLDSVPDRLPEPKSLVRTVPSRPWMMESQPGSDLGEAAWDLSLKDLLESTLEAI